MRLAPCRDEHGLEVTCVECDERLPLADAVADLDGKPFADYFCRACARRVVPLLGELETVTDRPFECLGLIEGYIDPEQYDSVNKWLRQCFSRPRDSELVMEALNEILGGFGVEAIRDESAWVDSYHLDIIATYVSTGDTYSATILLESQSGEFVVCSWGGWLEEWELEHREEE